MNNKGRFIPEGTEIGYFTVIGNEYRKSDKGTFYVYVKVRCVCGKELWVHKWKLSSGSSYKKHCGCIDLKHKKKTRFFSNNKLVETILRRNGIPYKVENNKIKATINGKEYTLSFNKDDRIVLKETGEDFLKLIYNKKGGLR